MRTPTLVLSLAALLTLSVALQVYRERQHPAPAPAADLLYMTSGSLIEKLALSFDALAADLYWIRAIQHFGGERLANGGGCYRQLYPLLDITTSLDPRFVIAYRFGALFLAEPFPGGAGRPDQAIRLLEKGLRAQPDKWEYQHDIGFVHYWQRGDFTQAAEAFTRAADIEGAPWWLRPLAATMATRGGQREASRFLWQQMLESAEDDWQRRTARTRLLQLDALDAIDRLRVVTGDLERMSGRFPSGWQELVERGVLRGVPVDPAGVPYFLDPENGFVTVAPESPLHPLPEEPTAREPIS